MQDETLPDLSPVAQCLLGDVGVSCLQQWASAAPIIPDRTLCARHWPPHLERQQGVIKVISPISPWASASLVGFWDDWDDDYQNCINTLYRYTDTT